MRSPNHALELIQREISEVEERENELRNGYGRQASTSSNRDSIENLADTGSNGTSNVTNGNGTTSSANGSIHGSTENLDTTRSNLTRAVSTSALYEHAPPVNGFGRRFISNPNQRGVMQKFYKTRGKLNATTAVAAQQKPEQPQPVQTPAIVLNPQPVMALTRSVPAYEPTDVLEPPKLDPNTGKPVRKGYVPVEERIQRELRELRDREEELRKQRRKSQPDLMAMLEAESDSRPSTPSDTLRPARSMAHLYDDDFSNDTFSAPASLRPAQSLAELCDLPGEELETPGSLRLIQEWESRIQQSQQDKVQHL